MTHSPTAAYRADIGVAAKSFGADDDGWIAIASLLSQASALPADEGAELLGSARELARAALLARPATVETEWGSPGVGTNESFLIVADEMYQAGALHLARMVLDSVLRADRSLSALDSGRLLARRARADARLGRLEEAADQFRVVSRLAKQIDSSELRIRAWNGHGALAQMRGNYPELMRYSQRAARLADRLDMRFLSRVAHNGLMVSAGAQHRFDDALHHARIAYRASLGNPIGEGETLQNIGHLLLEAGHSAMAGAVFVRVLNRSLPVRILLPALGGLALASANEGDVSRVNWVRSELARFDVNTGIPPYAYASALLECAVAKTRLGQIADARNILEVAVRVAEANGYHEIIIKADELRRAPSLRPPRVAARATPIVERLASELETGAADSLPRHVVTTSAGW